MSWQIPPIGRDRSWETLAFESISAGDALPEQKIPITTSLVVGGALASRDFIPVHHDKAAAQAADMPDVFMNILTTNGLVGRYVTDWAGMNAVLRGVAIKLGAPNVPGDTMTLSGSVKAVDPETRTVEVEVVGRNGWGEHVSGTVVVELPKGGA